VREIWKNLEMKAKEVTECCKQSVQGNSCVSLEDVMLTEMQTEKTELTKFQMGTRTLQGICLGPLTFHFSKELIYILSLS
jgi:hypothetical protein